MRRPRLRNAFIHVGAAVMIMSGVTLATLCDVVYDYNEWNDDGSVGDTGCRETNHSPICSKRGTCVCGQCKCEERANRNEIVSGQFCECTNFMCPRYNGMMCGGPDRGRCDCNVCRCHSGWSGKDCSCNKGGKGCVNPETGLVCSGNGECQCNECKCYSLNYGARYAGKYCQECPTCRGSCSTLKACVQCKIFGTGELTVRECENQCNFFNATTVTEAVPERDERLCSFYDENDCRFTFLYGYDRNKHLRVLVQSTLDCPVPNHGLFNQLSNQGQDRGADGVSRNESSILVFLSVITVIMYFCNV